MKERPILFSASMVRAILEGRKTQTRRVVKRIPLEWLESGLHPDFVAFPENGLSPYGQPGDRLWVRESWAYHPDFPESTHRAIYRADPGVENDVPRWRPSIHMPRWASRINLEVTGVRVERLQEISESDAKAEGCSVPEIIYPDEPKEHYSYAAAYKHLWESINGPGSWDANPWVWVVEFRRIAP